MHSPRRVDRINKCPVARIPPTTPPFCILKDVPNTLQMEKELVKKPSVFAVVGFVFSTVPTHPVLANVGKSSICHAQTEKKAMPSLTILTTAKRCGLFYYSYSMLMLNLKRHFFLRNIKQNKTKLFALHRFRIKNNLMMYLYMRAACQTK
jgi:hypothetical protein